MKPAEMSTSGKSPWLWVLLVLTLGLTIWIASQPEDEDDGADLLANEDMMLPDEIKKSVVKPDASVAPPGKLQPNGWQVRHREPLGDHPVDLFRTHTWAEAPAKTLKQATQAPPPPVAPQAPFAYVGKMEDGAKGTMIFLMGKNKVHTVAIGEKVDAMWRLDGEDMNSLKFTFLPLNLPQTLLKSQPLLSPDMVVNAENQNQ